ncbi:MAG: MutS-related protein, partial [Gaiellaceae bacterium]
MTTTFRSVLFPAAEPDLAAAREPDCFRDLNLDQLVAAVVAGREEYELVPFFHAPLRDVDDAEFRHEVFRDLERDPVRQAIEEFAEAERVVRRHLRLARKQRHRLEQERWFLDAAAGYCGTVSALRDALAEADLDSRGLRGWRDWLVSYTGSDAFGALDADSRAVLELLGSVRYSLRIKGLRVTVGVHEDEPDYSAEVEKTFERFRQGQVDAHALEVGDSGSMDHVEAQIADRVARLHPHEFAALAEFVRGHQGFVAVEVARFEREAQFYLAWLELADRLRSRGVAFCYPELSAETKDSRAEGAVDAALAEKLAATGGRPVANDFS